MKLSAVVLMNIYRTKREVLKLKKFLMIGRKVKKEKVSKKYLFFCGQSEKREIIQREKQNIQRERQRERKRIEIFEIKIKFFTLNKIGKPRYSNHDNADYGGGRQIQEKP